MFFFFLHNELRSCWKRNDGKKVLVPCCYNQMQGQLEIKNYKVTEYLRQARGFEINLINDFLKLLYYFPKLWRGVSTVIKEHEKWMSNWRKESRRISLAPTHGEALHRTYLFNNNIKSANPLDVKIYAVGASCLQLSARHKLLPTHQRKLNLASCRWPITTVDSRSDPVELSGEAAHLLTSLSCRAAALNLGSWPSNTVTKELYGGKQFSKQKNAPCG